MSDYTEAILKTGKLSRERVYSCVFFALFSRGFRAALHSEIV